MCPVKALNGGDPIDRHAIASAFGASQKGPKRFPHICIPPRKIIIIKLKDIVGRMFTDQSNH